jgi:NitT/TauT family transport system ATP-binding protein
LRGPLDDVERDPMTRTSKTMDSEPTIPVEYDLAIGADAPIGDPILEVNDLKVTYGRGKDAVRAIDGLSFAVGRNEFVSIVGPSGCGKTTLLKSIAGLLRPTSGGSRVAGREVDGPPPDLALVFQEYSRSLMPWLSVEKNVTFPLKARGMSAKERSQRGRAALEEVGLGGFEGKYPWQLSGGMQQRVAIARAVAYQPSVLLMDEPFASVDAQVRADLEDLVLRVHRDNGVTVIFVTHDIDESVYLGNRVLVLSKRPTTLRRSIEVGLPFPRDQLKTKAEPRFVELRTEVLRLIQHEKQAATSADAEPSQPSA